MANKVLIERVTHARQRRALGLGVSNRILVTPDDLRQQSPFILLVEDFIEPQGDFHEHPHRGLETVTFILAGALEHGDHLGSSGVLQSGDVHRPPPSRRQSALEPARSYRAASRRGSAAGRAGGAGAGEPHRHGRRLLASVAHELNQPIASMIMDAQTALRFMVREEADIASASRIVERIVRSADRIAGIVTRIRESISGRERSLTRVNLCQLAHDTAELLQRDIRQSDAALEVSCDAGTPLVSADPVELQQVLVNLILNASEAMADHEGERRIRVKVAHVDDGVTVSVSDTGRGFEPEVLDRLFEPFFTTKHNGVGMGLKICRSAVENLGGELQARNADECGAEFIFTLPVLDQEMAAACSDGAPALLDYGRNITLGRQCGQPSR